MGELKITICETCISCGMCSAVCPAGIIKMENNKPVLAGNNCISCGHCEAVCPKNALTNEKLNHDTDINIPRHPVIDETTAELFLRSRRSIRCFTEESVSKQETEKLVNIGRYAQTGSNSQGVSYIVVGTKEKMNQLKKITYEFFKTKDEPMPQSLYQRYLQTGEDIIFRGAPMCIVALTDINNPYTTPNAQYALTYIELYAPTLNLGTCWAGFFQWYASSNAEELRALLKVPEGLKISGALLYGRPKYQYQRLANRNSLNMEWI